MSFSSVFHSPGKHHGVRNCHSLPHGSFLSCLLALADQRLELQPLADQRLELQPLADQRLESKPLADQRLELQPLADLKVTAMTDFRVLNTQFSFGFERIN